MQIWASFPILYRGKQEFCWWQQSRLQYSVILLKPYCLSSHKLLTFSLSSSNLCNVYRSCWPTSRNPNLVLHMIVKVAYTKNQHWHGIPYTKNPDSLDWAGTNTQYSGQEKFTIIILVPNWKTTKYYHMYNQNPLAPPWFILSENWVSRTNNPVLPFSSNLNVLEVF